MATQNGEGALDRHHFGSHTVEFLFVRLDQTPTDYTARGTRDSCCGLTACSQFAPAPTSAAWSESREMTIWTLTSPSVSLAWGRKRPALFAMAPPMLSRVDTIESDGVNMWIEAPWP